MSSEIRVQRLSERDHSMFDVFEMIMPRLIANGIEVLASPSSRVGGWISIVGSTRSGFNPIPSVKTRLVNSNGELRNVSGKRNAKMINVKMVIAFRPRAWKDAVRVRLNSNVPRLMAKVHMSNDPAWPEYSDAILYQTCI
jgi:hypothetical protein